MTYPAPEVVEALAAAAVCHSVNTREPSAEGRELLRTYRLLWDPGLVFFDHRGTELRRVVGYRSPEHLLAELDMARGLRDELYRRHASSFEHFRRAARRLPEAEVAPEALYWAGIAAFRRGRGDKGALAAEWDVLRDRYPRSVWWQAADVLDFPPTGVRTGGSPPGESP